MADTNLPPLGLNDLLGLLGGANPLTGVTKTIQQFQRGVNDLLTAVEQFNATMEQLNLVAARVNRLLDDVEPAARALLPQITRTIETTESVVGQLGSLAALPRDVGEVVDLLRDLARRLQPLGQMAETAGGLFGLRSLAGGLRSAAPAPSRAPASSTTGSAPAPKPGTRARATAPAKEASAKASPAKAPARKAPAKKAPATTSATKAASRRATTPSATPTRRTKG